MNPTTRAALHDGTIPKSAINSGRYPERYRDDDLFPSDEEKLEVVTSDGEMNLDTLRQLCVAGTIQALSRQPYGGKTDQILKAFIEEKQKELSDAT